MSNFSVQGGLAVNETWLKDHDLPSSLELDGFAEPYRLDRDCWMTGKSLGGDLWFYVLTVVHQPCLYPPKNTDIAVRTIGKTVQRLRRITPNAANFSSLWETFISVLLLVQCAFVNPSISATVPWRANRNPRPEQCSAQQTILLFIRFPLTNQSWSIINRKEAWFRHG